jgi:hypothetical protein
MSRAVTRVTRGFLTFSSSLQGYDHVSDDGPFIRETEGFKVRLRNFEMDYVALTSNESCVFLVSPRVVVVGGTSKNEGYSPLPRQQCKLIGVHCERV